MKMIFMIPAIVTLVMCSSSTRAQLDDAHREIQPAPANEAHKSLTETEGWRQPPHVVPKTSLRRLVDA
jgi:hypothetical protein